MFLELVISSTHNRPALPGVGGDCQEEAATTPHSPSSSRRSLLLSVGRASAAALAISYVSPSPPALAAGLLDEYGTDPSKVAKREEETRAAAAAEMARKKASASASGEGGQDSGIEPNLRSNYYYPTNKKRYLPRIKKCNDAIPDAAAMIGSGDWEGAATFADKVADDTVLPMKLYTSSLLGGGTNVKVAFAKDMTAAEKDFEKAQKKLVKGIGKKDREASSQALEDLSRALLSY